MKKNKLLHKITFYLVLIFLMTSCAQQTSSAPESGGTNASGNSFLGIPLPENKYGTFRQISKPGYAITSDGLYEVKSLFPDSASIIYTDFATEKTIYLCNQPGCKHNTDACTSYVDLKDDWTPSIGATDDKLILIRGAATEASNPYIEIRNLDGSDNRKLCEFPANQNFEFYRISDNNYLFLTTREVDEGGNETCYLTEINLSSGEIKQIVDATTESGFYQLVGGYKNHLLLQEINFDTNTGRLILFNPEAPSFDNEIVQYIVNRGSIFISNNRLIVFESKTGELSTTDLDTGKKDTLLLGAPKGPLPSWVMPGFDDYIYFSQFMPDKDDEGEVIESSHLVDLNTGEMHMLTLKTSTFKEYFWDVIGVYGDKLCVLYDYKESSMVIEIQGGGMDTVNFYENLYGFISKEDYIANRPNMRPAQSVI